MISLQARTDLPPALVLARARTFFAEQRGMAVERTDWNGIAFRGAGGGLALEIAGREGELTLIDIVSREFDRAALDFARAIRPAPAPVRWWRRLTRRAPASPRELPMVRPQDSETRE